MGSTLSSTSIGQRLFFTILLLTIFIPNVLAASSSSGTWIAPEMPSWTVPAALAILLGVYALIVFELVHRALAAANPATPNLHTAASEPPATIISASPDLIILAASPIACAPVEQAVTTE